MNWMRLLAITLGVGAITSLTDWLFAGDWIHRRWTYPEIWRKGSETRAIAFTSPLPFLSCAVFACLSVSLGLHSVRSCLHLAFAIWLIAPLPLILANAAFIKLHRMFVVLYAFGWLVKLVVTGVAVGLFLH